MIARGEGSTGLQLAPVEGLAERQLRGADCVFCAARLDNATAVDLGTRTVHAHGTVTAWFPRACAGCA
ncbi:hypothetical protein [Streptomyces sp. NBC_01506]|uniref:hypothetical protein n=1 Tax=Streptomyces sp. NBC_01506 TaxID=2903887 RepID=UPI0038643E18